MSPEQDRNTYWVFRFSSGREKVFSSQNGMIDIRGYRATACHEIVKLSPDTVRSVRAFCAYSRKFLSHIFVKNILSKNFSRPREVFR